MVWRRSAAADVRCGRESDKETEKQRENERGREGDTEIVSDESERWR